MITPIHPGEILKEEFMIPYHLSANKLAARLHVPTNRITAIIAGNRAITADTALRLSDAFGTTPEFWMNLQDHYDLNIAQQSQRPNIETIVPSGNSAAAKGFTP